MQKKLLVAALGALFAMPVLAADAPAAPAAPYTITSNVGIISDYTFRGISQNFRSPAIQGGFDFVHSNGLFLGTWASNISGNQYSNASMEWDIYGGYNGKINDDLTYTAGLITVIYPGGKTNTVPSPNDKWDTTEWNLGATWKGLNLKYSQTLTNWYGIASTPGAFTPNTIVNNVATATSTANNRAANLDSKGSGYLEANYSYEFADKLVALAHVGHQKLKNFDLLSYTDYKVGVTKDLGGYVFGLTYTTTNAGDNQLYHVINAVGDNKNLRGGIVAVSVNRSF